MISSNVSITREVDEEMLATLLLLMLEVPGRSAGNLIPREALEVVGVGENLDVGTNVWEGMENKRTATKKSMDKPPTAMPATKTSTALKE